jgi:hypothetical protein
VPIEKVGVGDEVAAIDEKTGNKVWRKVVGRYSRLAEGSLDITVEDATGKRSTIAATSEHPFHVEDWDGKVETLIADLSPTQNLDPSRLFPSDEKTQFDTGVSARLCC